MTDHLDRQPDHDTLARLHRPTDPATLAREARSLADLGLQIRDIGQALGLAPAQVAGLLRHPVAPGRIEPSTNPQQETTMTAQPTYQALRETVNHMDCLSQDAFESICNIASRALRQLETPAGCRNLDHLAVLLEAILDKAAHTVNAINLEAEAVGCHFTDPTEIRRWQAQSLAQEAGDDAR